MAPVSSRPISVLLVDADQDRARTLSERLAQDEGRGPRLLVEHAGELRQALERLARGGVDVILLDLMLPDSEGLGSFEQAFAFAPDVPVVVLTDLDDQGVAVSAVKGGAQDYLVRDEVDRTLLVRSIRYAIERHRLLSALRSLSLIDDLTGLYNRRGFMELGTQFLKLSRRSGRGGTVLFLDLDRFKTINDEHGHHVGDRALAHVADIMRSAFRRSDLVARVGGDEFAVLAPAGPGEPAERLAARVREGLEEFNRTGTEPYELRASLGVARFESGERTGLEALLASADSDMYEEKRSKLRMTTS
jgi:two-component system, cell cycle response regulator